MMINDSKFDFIKKILIGIKTEVEIDSSLKQYDINIKSEILFMHILNDVYGWKLEDANKIRDNFKAIDLIDNINRYVIQVTSNTKPKKVDDTIKGFLEFNEDDLYRQYANYKLKIFYIGVSVNFSDTVLKRFSENKVKKEDLLSITHILNIVNSDSNICDKLYATLKKLFDTTDKILTTKNINVEKDLIGAGSMESGAILTQNITNNNYYPNDTIKTNLKRKYKEVKEFKKAIFTYYSIYGTNFDSFTRATTFDELFNILEKEEVCLYCLSKELGKEYEFLTQPINCDELKVKIESINREEISGLILRINWNKVDKTCTIDGYLRFTSESFEPLKNVYEEVIFSYQTVKDIVEENLESRRHARSIELQLILPNELYDTSMNFQCENNKIKIVKRLLLRIENYTQSDEINEIAFWQRNSNFYQNHQEDNVEDDSFHNIIEEFQEYDDDKHICLLSNICLNASIKEIYDYGVPIAFYSYSKECEIINNLDFTNKKVKNIKNTIFRFMKKNRETHFIYDDYNDLDFLKLESKVEGTEDDYL